MNKKCLIWGGLFGLIAPFIGIFAGLQISTTVGNILAFPIIGLSALTGVPFGMWGAGMMLFAFALSVVVWALIFSLIAKLFTKKTV